MKRTGWLIALFVPLSLLFGGAAQAKTLLWEDFDAAVPPALVHSWVVDPAGGPLAWTTASDVGHGSDMAPYSGGLMARLNCRNHAGTVNLLCLQSVNSLSALSLTMSFYMLHDSDDNSDDGVRVIVSTDLQDWNHVGPNVRRYVPALPGQTWMRHDIDLIDYINVPALYVGFEGTSDSGEDIFLDNVWVHNDTAVAAAPETGTTGMKITVTGAGFGLAPGRVLLLDGEKGTKLKATAWSDTSIEAPVKKAPKAGVSAYFVVIQTAEKGSAPIIADDLFRITTPAVASLSVNSGAPGTAVTLTGTYYGAKKGKVYLVPNGGGKPISCKVSTWTQNIGDENASAVVVVPKAPVGLYTIQLVTALGTADAPGTFAVIAPL